MYGPSIDHKIEDLWITLEEQLSSLLHRMRIFLEGHSGSLDPVQSVAHKYR